MLCFSILLAFTKLVFLKSYTVFFLYSFTCVMDWNFHGRKWVSKDETPVYVVALTGSKGSRYDGSLCARRPKTV
jgi:hypothetical protein